MFRGGRERREQEKSAERGSESTTVYQVVYRPDFISNLDKARQLLACAKSMSSLSIHGSEAMLADALDLVDAFNQHIDGLRLVAKSGRFGALPPITHDGVPVGASKHYSFRGWMTGVILDVSRKVAHVVSIEPNDRMRERLNRLTGGQAGE